jgi:mannose-6-phosphate isomerase-like protein (cupin superfamily)
MITENQSVCIATGQVYSLEKYWEGHLEFIEAQSASYLDEDDM